MWRTSKGISDYWNPSDACAAQVSGVMITREDFMVSVYDYNKDAEDAEKAEKAAAAAAAAVAAAFACMRSGGATG